MTDQEIIRPTDYQAATLAFRNHFATLAAGGRGSGKTFGMMLAIVDHARKYGPAAKILILREQWKSLLELQFELLQLCITVFSHAQRNKTEGTIYCSNGATLVFSNVSDENSYARQQGANYTMLAADEVGNYPPQAWKFLQLVRSNLRGPVGLRPEIIFCANPFGRSHSTLFKNWVSQSPPWHPFVHKDGTMWVWTESNLTENPHIDQELYKQQLIAATMGQPELAEAWITGKWSAGLSGMMFQVFDPSTHVIEKPQGVDWKWRCGGDWGTAAPAACILLGQCKHDARLSDGRVIKFGSIVAVEEVDTAADPDNLNIGNGAPPQMFAEMIKEMCARHGWDRPYVIQDDARGLASETVIDLFRLNGIQASKPVQKDRVGQWSLLNQLLSNAVTGDGPGFYITPQCPHLIETLPEAPRGTLRAEDIDPKWLYDHWIDATVYGLRDLWGRKATQGTYITG